MGFKYTVRSDELYFLTFTVDYIDVFTRRVYKDTMVDSLRIVINSIMELLFKNE